VSKVFIPKEELAGYQRFDLGALSGGRAHGGAAANPAESQTARETARAEGYVAGYSAGAEQVRAEAARLRTLASAYEQGLAKLEADVAEEVLDLALEVARQVLRADPKLRREGLLAVVREALATLPQGVAQPKLALNPGDAELVRAQIGDEIAAGGLRIVEDFRIEPGGCRVSAPSGDVDATLATRWRRVIATLGKDHAWIEE
jgi:flagellar assembly protein FliH